MRQLTLTRPRALQWLDVPEPQITAAGDALVRPIAVSRCDGDRIFLFRDPGRLLRIGVALRQLDERVLTDFGRHPFQLPIPVGHECVAEVLQVGPDIQAHHRGDVVVVPFQVSCGQCPRCRAGRTGSCATTTSRTPFAVYGFGASGGGWGGAISDVLRVPYADHMLVPVPVGIDPATVAAAGDNLADGWRAVAGPLLEDPAAPVLVLGGAARSVALYATAAAVALGAERVDYVDHHPDRLAIAERLGAHPIPVRTRQQLASLATARKGSYRIAVDGNGRNDSLSHALNMLSPGGRLTSVTWPLRRRSPVPLWRLYTDDIHFSAGRAHVRPDIPRILAHVDDGRLRPQLVTTLHATWDEAPDALLAPSTKVVLSRPRSTDQTVTAP